MKRFFVAFITFVACYFVLVPPSFAEDEFTIAGQTEYAIGQAGTAKVTHTITLTNRFSQIHAVSYLFTIQGTKPTNIRALEGQTELPTQVGTNDDKTTITITFPKAVVGKGNSRIFTIEYADDQIAIKNGQVWEITIPKLENPKEYEGYRLILSVPSTFGDPAYISPQPEEIRKGDHTSFIYNAEQLIKSGVVAAFGTFQVFNFELDYHIQNPLSQAATTEIAIPPDTSFQRVYYESIKPAPLSIHLDQDGNWLAQYSIETSEQLDIKAKGAVQLFASPQTFYPNQSINSQTYLEPSEYWQVEDTDIKELAKQLKTPKAIYDFVVSKLSYDYDRVQEGVQRLGAQKVLASPSSAICMEFTDLFIALARAAGIPSREVNGFAYTENPELQPLSLVADVLHAWPEYWDEQQEVWRPVDPTWGNTTGGVDYFSKFDLSHITFAIHGQSANQPLPAGSYKVAENPQKDVVVFFGDLPQTRTPQISLNFHLSRRIFPFLPLSGTLEIENKGPVALYDVKTNLSASNTSIILSSDSPTFVAPFTKVILPFQLTNNSLLFSGRQLPRITGMVGGVNSVYQIPQDMLIWEIIGSFFILLFVTIALLALILLRKKIVRLLMNLIGRKDTNDKNQPPNPSRESRRLPF